MNFEQLGPQDMHQILDMAEQACTVAVLTIFSSTKPFMTEDQARQVVSKVGLRIAVGPQLFDAAIKPEMENKT